MKKLLLLAFAFLPAALSAQEKAPSPVDLINPLMGTQSKPSLSNGNTYPAVALPWGMNFWTPQTGKMGDGWQYTYDADKILGFKQTHQPSPWMNDYGMFSVFPETGKLKLNEKDRASWFSHKAEVSKPYYYSVYLADADVTTEITPTERAAQLRFTFPASDSSFIVVDAFDKGSYIKIIPAEKKIIGYTSANSGGVPANFKNYFVLYFDKAFQVSKVWKEKEFADGLELTNNHVGAVIGFKTAKGERITAKVASSFISFEQAEAVKRGMALPEGVEAKPIQPIIETVSETLALEVKKTFDFYRTTAQESEATIQKILLAGGGSKLPGLPDFLAQRFDIPVEVFDPFRQIEVDATKFDPDYMREIVPEMAVAVGLALRGVEA